MHFKAAVRYNFFVGDIEKKHNLEVSQLCDRETNTVGNIQIGKEWVTFICTYLNTYCMYNYYIK